MIAFAKNLRRASMVLVASGIVGFSSSSIAYEVIAHADGVIGHSTTPGDVSYSYTFDGGFYGSSALVTFTSSPVASVSYSATAFNPVGQVGLNGGGFMTYRFEVEAAPNTYVPIDFSGLYSSYQGSKGNLAATSFLVQTVNSSVFNYASFQSNLYGDCGPQGGCLQYSTFNNTTYTSTQSDASNVEGSFDGTLDMLTGADGKVIGLIQLGAIANLYFALGTRSASAFIDPHLEIDAAFLLANPGATLTIEAGVGNEISRVSAVPEPSTYALMLAGLVAVVVGKRRRIDRNNKPA